MKQSSDRLLVKFFAILLAGTVVDALFVLFTTWILSLIIDWPVTWGNFFITWGCIIVLRFIFGGKSKDTLYI